MTNVPGSERDKVFASVRAEAVQVLAGALGCRLPDVLVSRGLELAAQTFYRGIPLADLTRDELLAVAALSFDVHRQERVERARRDDFLSNLSSDPRAHIRGL